MILDTGKGESRHIGRCYLLDEREECGDKQRSFNLLLNIYESLGEARALEGYERIMRNRPEIESEVRYNKGRYYQLIGEYDKALEVFEELEAILELKEQTPILVNIGNIYKDKGMLAHAEDSYKAAMRSDDVNYPNNDMERSAETRLGMVEVYIETGRYKEAKEFLRLVELSRVYIESTGFMTKSMGFVNAAQELDDRLKSKMPY